MSGSDAIKGRQAISNFWALHAELASNESPEMRTSKLALSDHDGQPFELVEKEVAMLREGLASMREELRAVPPAEAEQFLLKVIAQAKELQDTASLKLDHSRFGMMMGNGNLLAEIRGLITDARQLGGELDLAVTDERRAQRLLGAVNTIPSTDPRNLPK